MKADDELQRELDKVVPLKRARREDRTNDHAKGEPGGPEQPGTRDGPREGEQQPASIRPIRFADLVGKAPPPRRFVVDQWLPAGCVTSLYGPGGIGKTMLAQQVATCVATGQTLFGNVVEQGPVLGLLAEDDDDELWRRQVGINDWLGSGMDGLEHLHLQGRAGLENTLAVYPANGPPSAQHLHDLVREKAAELRPVLIILDPIAQLYGGNENDRFQVSHFVNLVGGLAREFDCAVLLLGHPAKAEGSEYSGSTARNASVRSRLLLQREEGDEEGLLRLSRVKSNYAKPDAMKLRWASGTLRPIAPMHMTYGDRLDAEQRSGAARQAFLDALDGLTAQGINVSHSNQASNYAPKVMLEAGMVDGFSRAELGAALNELLKEGCIAANRKMGQGPDRHPVHGLARVGADG